ncbi:hypothetical protein M407DRAFT_217869 [Tulasnella calospora MUT 4182]|uniref:Uncharacterized protein n=1 Tax=Tulasnella calospora MUT 4182 TaxID=1051891 RepID=A0A0C3QIC9_9AGAM|nr:hypothetical protein M407DRAFT_217869 [Tulasnella calospora MUT 4182]
MTLNRGEKARVARRLADAITCIPIEHHRRLTEDVYSQLGVTLFSVIHDEHTGWSWLVAEGKNVSLIKSRLQSNLLKGFTTREVQDREGEWQRLEQKLEEEIESRKLQATSSSRRAPERTRSPVLQPTKSRPLKLATSSAELLDASGEPGGSSSSSTPIASSEKDTPATSTVLGTSTSSTVLTTTAIDLSQPYPLSIEYVPKPERSKGGWQGVECFIQMVQEARDRWESVNATVNPKSALTRTLEDPAPLLRSLRVSVTDAGWLVDSPRLGGRSIGPPFQLLGGKQMNLRHLKLQKTPRFFDPTPFTLLTSIVLVDGVRLKYQDVLDFLSS